MRIYIDGDQASFRQWPAIRDYVQELAPMEVPTVYVAVTGGGPNVHQDWNNAISERPIGPVLASVAVEQIPLLRSNKESSDTALTIRATLDAVTSPERVLLVSGDTGFAPLVRFLQATGRQVYGMTKSDASDYHDVFTGHRKLESVASTKAVAGPASQAALATRPAVIPKPAPPALRALKPVPAAGHGESAEVAEVEPPAPAVRLQLAPPAAALRSDATATALHNAIGALASKEGSVSVKALRKAYALQSEVEPPRDDAEMRMVIQEFLGEMPGLRDRVPLARLHKFQRQVQTPQVRAARLAYVSEIVKPFLYGPRGGVRRTATVGVCDVGELAARLTKQTPLTFGFVRATVLLEATLNVERVRADGASHYPTAALRAAFEALETVEVPDAA